MNITLRQIEVFFYTARLGSLSKAADRLCITQAAASMALRELENQLDEKLFDRTGKKLVLNENGRAVVTPASELMGRTTELEGFFNGGSGLSGHLVIGASSTVGNYVLPEYIAVFIDSNKKSTVDLKVGNTEEIIGRVLKFETDIGVIEGVCSESAVRVIPWTEDELAVFVSARHPLASKENVTAADLEGCDWILREKGSGTRDAFENQARELGMNINIRTVLGHTEAVKNAVANGHGVGCLSRRVLEELESLGQIKLLKTDFFDLRRSFYVILHKDKYVSNTLNSFFLQLGVNIREHLKTT